MQIGRARAACAAALAIAFVATTFLAGWHQATVIHARCARHGELFHVGAGVHKKLGEHQLAARDAGGGDSEHDHCQLCPRSHDGAPPMSAHVPVAMPPVAPAPRSQPRIAIVTSDHPLAHAPKTSPPRLSASFA
jgi:hypothetical protein